MPVKSIWYVLAKLVEAEGNLQEPTLREVCLEHLWQCLEDCAGVPDLYVVLDRVFDVVLENGSSFSSTSEQGTADDTVLGIVLHWSLSTRVHPRTVANVFGHLLPSLRDRGNLKNVSKRLLDTAERMLLHVAMMEDAGNQEAKLRARECAICDVMLSSRGAVAEEVSKALMTKRQAQPDEGVFGESIEPEISSILRQSFYSPTADLDSQGRALKVACLCGLFYQPGFLCMMAELETLARRSALPLELRQLALYGIFDGFAVHSTTLGPADWSSICHFAVELLTGCHAPVLQVAALASIGRTLIHDKEGCESAEQTEFLLSTLCKIYIASTQGTQYSKEVCEALGIFFNQQEEHIPLHTLADTASYAIAEAVKDGLLRMTVHGNAVLSDPVRESAACALCDLCKFLMEKIGYHQVLLEAIADTVCEKVDRIFPWMQPEAILDWCKTL